MSSEDTQVFDNRQRSLLSLLTGLPPEYVTANRQQFNLKRTPQDFGRYIGIMGIEHFSADEFLQAHHREKAIALGYKSGILIPPLSLWHRGAVLGILADACRKAGGQPVRLRNWWRPGPRGVHGSVGDYNSLAAGSKPGSDHVSASAVDLDWIYGASTRDGRKARERALEVLRPLWEARIFELSIGVGMRTIHLGIMAGKGQRSWTYGPEYRPRWMR